MINGFFSLTKNEMQIMNLLWMQNRPLSRSEIIELSEERSWKASSIHILLNSLLEKKAIKVDGFVKTGKNYGRTFSFAITKEEYQIIQLEESTNCSTNDSSLIINLFSALIEKESINEDTLKRLSAIIEKKRSEIE